MVNSKNLFVLFILIMMPYSSSEDDIVDEVVVVESTCAETVHEVMEEAFGEVTAEVVICIQKYFRISLKYLIFLILDQIQFYSYPRRNKVVE